MRPTLLLFLIIICPISCMAQFHDDFSDGDFTDNPAWFGNDSLFVINEEGQLQLNADSGGNASLSVNYKKNDNMEWRFWIREKFSPSSNNYCDVYLYSDNSNLKAANQAYILRFGESGSEDVVELLHKENDDFQSVCRGKDTFIASSFSTFVKVTYDRTNSWNIYLDKDGHGAFLLEANGTDDDFMLYDEDSHFGFECIYTNSNTKNFYFDNIYIGDKIIDSIAPELISCEAIDDFHIELIFSEAVKETTAFDTNNYIIDKLDLSPKEVRFGDNLSTLILEYGSNIPQGEYLDITIKNIEDYEGNIAETITYKFIYYNAKYYDIVINEIMADPTPPIELPEFEYIELYNTSDFPISLKEWTLTIGNSEYHIDDNIEIQGNNYLILCHNDATESLSNYGSCYGFPTFQISNSGANIVLSDKDDNLITSVDFDISWHSSSYKEEGGWSLEQIDYEQPCAGKPNWSSSKCGAGGTPGKLNSINNDNIISPEVDYVFTESKNTLDIYFTQNMNLESLQKVENYYLIEKQIHPKEINAIPNKNNFVRLIFDQEFDEGQLYTLNINNVLNCKDVRIEDEVKSFGIPSTTEPNDIIINEILFNPIDPGVDYIEIYNKSDKIIDLSKLMIGVIKESFPNPADTIVKEICNKGRIILPNSYLLLSTDSEIVKYQYDSFNKNFFDVESIPSLPNEEGRVIICNRARAIIDEMYYSDKMHYDLLVETKGVALERISFDAPSYDINNWHSASYNVNYGTPGYENSMALDYTENNNDNGINIIPEIFSPDGDGFDDICRIHYNLDKNGYSMNIKVFNSKGILVRNLFNNNLVESKGQVTWNGCDDNGKTVEPGIYIVQSEIFDGNGSIKRIRKCVVVSTK